MESFKGQSFYCIHANFAIPILCTSITFKEEENPQLLLEKEAEAFNTIVKLTTIEETADLSVDFTAMAETCLRNSRFLLKTLFLSKQK